MDRAEKNAKQIEEYGRVGRFLTGTLDTIAGRSTTPLYSLNANGSPRPIGTGVLFRAGEKVFILTAAHVLESSKKDLFVPYDERFLMLHRAYWAKNRLREGAERNADPYDVGVIQIPVEIAHLFHPLAANVANLRLPIPDPETLRGLVLVGFPARDFRISGPFFVSPPKALESSTLPRYMYERLARNHEDHIVLKWYNTCVTSKGITDSPSLAGMSGCGVWLVPELVGGSWPDHPPFQEPKLMGIFTDHVRNRSALTATKIHLHIDTLMNAFPPVPIKRDLIKFRNAIPIDSFLDPGFERAFQKERFTSAVSWYREENDPRTM